MLKCGGVRSLSDSNSNIFRMHKSNWLESLVEKLTCKMIYNFSASFF